MAILACCSCCSGAPPYSWRTRESLDTLRLSMSGKLQIVDPRLEPIAQKVLASERLTADDGLALFQSHDLLAVGWLANHVREQRHGNICYFNVNRHINPTNV